MENLLLIFALLIIVSYILMMRKLRQNAKAYDDVDFNLSVASYTPNLKPGNYQVTITALGEDLDATLQTVNRFRDEPITAVTIGDVVALGLNMYSCEDLLFELNYIGADGLISEMESNDN